MKIKNVDIFTEELNKQQIYFKFQILSLFVICKQWHCRFEVFQYDLKRKMKKKSGIHNRHVGMLLFLSLSIAEVNLFLARAHQRQDSAGFCRVMQVTLKIMLTLLLLPLNKKFVQRYLKLFLFPKISHFCKKKKP